MSGETRTTVYLKPTVYRALKVKAATTDRTVSELINQAVLEALREDAVDLEACEKRSKEPARQFEAVLEGLKRDGLV
ncbi:MAG: ribbon-helix-helix protein, CopG family [Nitrospirales bacterium]